MSHFNWLHCSSVAKEWTLLSAHVFRFLSLVRCQQSSGKRLKVLGGPFPGRHHGRCRCALSSDRRCTCGQRSESVRPPTAARVYHWMSSQQSSAVRRALHHPRVGRYPRPTTQPRTRLFSTRRPPLTLSHSSGTSARPSCFSPAAVIIRQQLRSHTATDASEATSLTHRAQQQLQQQQQQHTTMAPALRPASADTLTACRCRSSRSTCRGATSCCS